MMLRRTRRSLLRVPLHGDPIPELKRQLGAQIAARIASFRSSDAAVLIGTDQPRVSDLRRGKLERFSLETLIRFLARLRYDMVLRVEPRRQRD